MTNRHASWALAAAILGCAAPAGLGQVVYTPAQSPPVSVVPTAPMYSEAQLEQLVAPIALYPDPLLGEILPAATYPSEVTAAAQFIATFPNSTEESINAQTWEPSIKAIAHYPTVLQMMASQPDWMAALGAAFLNQQGDLLAAIQTLRLQAQQRGNLVTTPQEQVVTSDGAIDIVPQDSTVYVPTYDPTIVYTQACPIVWGGGFAIGPWLDIDFDWMHRGLFLGHRWDQRFDAHVDFSHERPWVRNFEKPVPVVPRGFVVRQGVGPRVVPGPGRGFIATPAPGAFGAVQPRAQVEAERARGAAVAHPVIPVAPRPVAPTIVRPVPTPVVVHPAPAPIRPAPEPIRPIAPPVERPAFTPAPGRAVQAQSDRGHASMKR